VVGAGALHLEVDGAGDDVARREVAARVVLFMKGVPSSSRSTAPSPRKRLGDEEGLRLRVIEAGRVELVELHVRDLGPRAVRHRETVARRDVRVRRIEVDLALPRPSRARSRARGS
jgi:hypothetical protein